MKPVSRLRIVLTVILWIIAVLSVLWAFVPSFRVSIQNAWLRATGRDSEQTVTYAPEDADPIFSFEMPEGFELESYTETVPFASAYYLCPERGEEAMIQVMVSIGINDATFDTENAITCEEMTIRGNSAVYVEKIYPGTHDEVTRSVHILSSDPVYYISFSTCCMTREETLTIAETMTLDIPERFRFGD